MVGEYWEEREARSVSGLIYLLVVLIIPRAPPEFEFGEKFYRYLC